MEDLSCHCVISIIGTRGMYIVQHFGKSQRITNQTRRNMASILEHGHALVLD